VSDSVPVFPVQLLTSFAEVGRALLSGPRQTGGPLAALPDAAVKLIPHAAHASSTQGRNGRFATVAATGPLPASIDQIQYELGTGPCVDAILRRATFRTGRLEADPRWPEFGARAADIGGVHSMLSVRLYLEDDDLLAGLNMYSTEHDAFTAADEAVATLLATHGALALTAAREHEEAEQMRSALERNRTIGAAIGILMSAHKITQQQGFDLLRIYSQRNNQKIFDVAQAVVETGMLG
jgi:GAF domain-containing protein